MQIAFEAWEIKWKKKEEEKAIMQIRHKKNLLNIQVVSI